MQHSAQRVGVFVDVQNMYYSARALFEQKVDFGEILKEAVGSRHLIRAFAYVISAENDDEDSFFEALASRGYELRAKKLLNFYGGNSKGDWDVGIAMDVVRMLPKLDVLVLVSGDGDFAELLKYAKSQGVRAEVMAFGSSASSQLREEADAVFDLAQDPARFLIGRKTLPMKKKARTMEGQAFLTLQEGQDTNTHPPQQQKEKQQPPRRELLPKVDSRQPVSGAKPFTLPQASSKQQSSGSRSSQRSRRRSRGGRSANPAA